MKREEIKSKVVAPKLHERFRGLLDRIFPDDASEAEFAHATKEDSDFSSLSGLNLIIEYEDSKGNRPKG